MDTNSQPVVFFSGHAAWSDSSALACLDALMSFAVFEIPVVLVLHGAGVLQALRGQDGTALGLKTLAQRFGALPLYGVTEVLVDAASLTARQLQTGDLLRKEDDAEIVDWRLVQREELARLLADARAVYTF